MAAALLEAGVAEHWNRHLQAGRERLRAEYLRRPAPRQLLHAHARLVDGVLRGLWTQLNPAPIDVRFGRCAYFLIVETEDLDFEAGGGPARARVLAVTVA